MTLSQFLKDYIDSINNFYDSFSGHVDLNFILKFAIFYISQSAKILFQYILSFRWFNDFYSINTITPHLINSNFIDSYSTEIPIYNFLNFFDTPNLSRNFILSGFLNSFALSLPFSASQVLWLRRLTIEGIPAGISSGFGTIVGQLILNVSILLGLRFIVFPWFSLEFLSYILGIFFLLSIIYIIANRPIRRIKSFETTQLVKIFISHLILTWTEHTIVFQYFSNISLNSEPTLFEILDSENQIYFIAVCWNYLFGLFFGSIFWKVCFGWIALSIGYSSSKFFKFSYSIWVRNFHFFSSVLIIALVLTSFPYYNLDYLATSPLGLVSQDQILKNFQLKTTSFDLRKGRLGEYSSHSSLDTDISIFDKGRYLTSSEVELTFEDLNYQGEYIWRSRNDRLAAASGGLVNKLLRKFLPRLKNARSKLGLNLKTKKKQIVDSDLLEDIDENDQYEVYPPLYTFLPDTEDMVQRFLGDYQMDVANSPIPDIYQEIDPEPYSAFSEIVRYGFDSFATFEEAEADEFEEKLGKKIKSKYYSNIVYKTILNLELSNFLTRQPKNYSLKKEEENELFINRLILANYYDSLRDYSEIPYIEPFQHLFLGPKSYANRVYNQQFKGTMKILRRLFSVNLEKKDNLTKKNILKYDQPLYNEELDDENAIVHEELNDFYEDSQEQSPFLREVDPIPFYVGWDDNLRKFIISNYWLSYSDAGIKTNYADIFKSNRGNISFLYREEPKISFITWPIEKQKIDKLKYKPQKSTKFLFSSFDEPNIQGQIDVFEYAEIDDYDIRLIYKTLPSILKRLDVRDKEKEEVALQPLRGGLLWPGSGSAKLKFKNVLNMLKQLRRDWRDSNP